jgi:hypothetical protein
LVEDTKEDLNYYIKYNDYFLHDWIKTISMISYNNPKELNYEEAFFSKNFWEFYNFFETKKEIRITWIIKTQTRSELLEEMRKMKKYLYEKNKYLVIKENGEKKQIKWFCKISFSENHYNINFINFEINFTSFDYLENYEALSFFWNYTTWKFIFSNDWSAQSKYWINIIATSNIYGISINVNWNIITINESFISWDIIFIDWYSQTIKKNTELINFSWEILFLNPWYNEIQINWNGSFDFLIFSNISYK